MSLYTKYRSQTFDDLVEQDSVKQILKNQVLKINSWESKLSNYIFFGPRGTGKTSVARIFSRAINCTNWTDGNPCNQCDACLSIINNRTLDVVEIDAASHTWVDNIRDEIISKAVYPPSSLRKKIYIIDEAHMLSKSAFNALLKIIEEPPEYLVFILATTDPQKILDTVKSRCQMFGFKNISMDGIINRLKYVCNLESIKYDEAWLNLIAKIANGWLRDALKYLDQVSGVGDATGDIVMQALGIAWDSMIVDFINSYMSDNSADIYTRVDGLSNAWLDIGNFLKDLWQYIDRNLTVSNMAIYMPIIQVIKWYFENIRNYPFPNTVLKHQIALAKWVSANIVDKQDFLTSLPTAKSPQVTVMPPQPKAPDPVIVPEPPKQEIQEPVLAEVPVVENIIDNSQEQTNPESMVNQSENISETQKTSDVIQLVWQTDFWSIKQYIIDNSGMVIKWIWAKSCDITSYENNIINVAVINAWSIVVLNTKKSDTEKLASELLGQEVSIIYNVVNSEDLLQNMLDDVNFF
jgi:DNA polymerase III subunit gamma/tau